jgi:subtilisin family serine protease
MKLKTASRVGSLLLAGGFLQALFINASPVSTPASAKKFNAGRILVQSKAGLSKDKLDRLLNTHGGKRVSEISQIRVHVVQVPSGAEEAVAEALSHNPVIEFAEVDGIAPLSQTPDDPYFPNQWHHTVVETPAAWDVATGAGVTIAILDTGVDGTHPDLAARMVSGWNTYEGNSNSSDVYGHGTKVAGTSVAIGNNALGVTGMAPNSLIMPIRISALDGTASYSAAANGLTWAADHGARVANISYVMNGSLTVQNAAQYLKNKGGLTVNSAGNYGVLDSTSANDTMITVSATDGSDNRTSWSSFGPYVDLSAPGAGIYTTTVGGGYAAVSGTSFSSPLTAGVIALMMSANPSLSPAQLTSILFSTARDIGDAGWDQYYGHGRVNAAAAVQAAKAASTNVRDTDAPSVSISEPTGGATLSGVVSVNASASDSSGVSRVELYANGNLVGTDSAAPYSFSLDTTLLSEGAVTISAKALDAAGNLASASVTAVVRNAPVTADTSAPTVTILNPKNGSTLGRGSLSISASATDNVAVTLMTISVDGVLKASSATGAISTSISLKKISTGSHVIRVDAKDAAGNVSSSSVTVTK